MSNVVGRLNAALEGRYRIVRELGEGGMATVYLAEDLRHQREVALKVLMPELAAVVGADRFLAEIRTTAGLRHPHVLPLFDSGEADSFLYYVMPLVEGETLRERLERDRQLPVDEAVRIATAVAHALQHAHDKGVVHRDIKPGNILLQDGQPVVSDFGIALAVGSARAARLTETGLSVGTPYYMSPEQAVGDQAVGPPTDTYALACTLYEMLAGDPPYIGSTAQAVLGKIILADPVPVTEIRRAVPANVDAAIRRGLEKLPADRFARTEDFARALADPGFEHNATSVPATTAHPRSTLAALAVLSTLTAGLAAWGWLGRGPGPAAGAVTRLTATLPEDHRIALRPYSAFPLALSPDGRTAAYVGESSTGTRLYVRGLDSFESVALTGTEGARQPFFSPDGEWIAYFDSERLSRVRVSGGAPLPVADFEGVPAGGAWGPDGLVVFATDSTLWRVRSEGGQPEPVPLSIRAPVSWPRFLPESAGGRRAPLVLVSAGGELHAVSITDGEARPLGIRTDGHGLYLPGFLVYSEQSGVVRAAPFDVESLSVTGASISVLENVLRPNFTDATLLTASHDGTIVYVPGTSERRLVLVDRAGHETALPFEPGPYRSVAVSPDGLRLLVDRRGEPLRILEVETGRDRPAAGVLRGVWSPGGNEILAAAGASGVVRSSVAPGSTPVSVTEDGPFLFPAHWGADGIALFFTFDYRAENRGGLHTMRLDRDAAPVPLIDTEADERWITRSPDGRWIAYASDLSGTTEVYVREFPGGEPRQVSVNGAEHAVFSRGGDELYFLSGERMYALRTEQLGAAGSLDPELLFEGSYVLLGPSWDVRPQGDFLMISAGRRWLREILVVQGWVDELEALFDDAVR